MSFSDLQQCLESNTTLSKRCSKTLLIAEMKSGRRHMVYGIDITERRLKCQVVYIPSELVNRQLSNLHRTAVGDLFVAELVVCRFIAPHELTTH